MGGLGVSVQYNVIMGILRFTTFVIKDVDCLLAFYMKTIHVKNDETPSWAERLPRSASANAIADAGNPNAIPKLICLFVICRLS